MSILIKSNSSRANRGPDDESWMFCDLEGLAVVVEDLDGRFGKAFLAALSGTVALTV